MKLAISCSVFSKLCASLPFLALRVLFRLWGVSLALSLHFLLDANSRNLSF